MLVQTPRRLMPNPMETVSIKAGAIQP
jgi:hypothetical protein